VIGAKAVGILILSSLLTLPLAGQHPANGGGAPHGQQKNAGPGRLGDWLRGHQNLTPDQQEKALENDPGFKRLTPERQTELKERLRKFNSLNPKQRENAIRRMEYWSKLTADQRKQVREANQQLQTLPPDRVVAVHKALRHLRQMTPQERQQEFQSERFRTFSPQEQNILKSLADINPPENENAR